MDSKIVSDEDEEESDIKKESLLSIIMDYKEVILKIKSSLEKSFPDFDDVEEPMFNINEETIDLGTFNMKNVYHVEFFELNKNLENKKEEENNKKTNKYKENVKTFIFFD